jgi:hypothetical protein
MSALRRAALGVWDFVVGDDWRLALGTVVILGAVAGLVAAGIDAWWLAPPAVPVILAASLRSSASRRP